MDSSTKNREAEKAATLAAETIRKADAGARASEIINKAATGARTTTGPGQKRGPSQLNQDMSYTDAAAANDSRYTTVDKTFTSSAYEENLLQPVGIGRQQKKGDRIESSETTDGETPRPQNNLSKTLQRRLLDRAVEQPLKALAKVRVTSFNASAIAWYTPLWLVLQLPFAILMIVGLGSVYAIDRLTTDDGGIISFITAKLAQAALKTLDLIVSIFGANFEEIALGLLSVSYVMIFAFGMLSLAGFTLAYVFIGCRPLSGAGAGLKNGMFLLAMIGYATPVLNMFPFILLYMAAVWLNPR